MQFSVTTQSLSQLNPELLLVVTFEDKIMAEEKLVDKFFGNLVTRLKKTKDFTGEVGKTRLFFSEQHIPRILLAGLGKSRELTLNHLREAISAAVQESKKLAIQKVAILVPTLPGFSVKLVSQTIVETVILTAYEFIYYKKPESKNTTPWETVELCLTSSKNQKTALEGVTTGQILGESVTLARDLGNHPGNVATPTHLAEHAAKIAKTAKHVTLKILHRSQIKQEKMGGLLAVSQGSEEEPKFIILEYLGRKRGPSVVLVGKGITFDSGGISIKPSEKMEEMKYDMAGAATVMGIIKAASALALPINLVGLIPATENLPSGKAIKPGDIVRSRSGKTIEIISTDAEGRMVLCDALDYAKKYKPVLVINLATLTGAIVGALGDDLLGAFTNEKKLLPQLETAAEMTGEKIWPMPLYKEYEQFIKSDFADLRNIGTTRYGDAINAANFLQNFVDYPWIHLDIAGVAWATREKPYRPKGATGTGVRLVIEFLKNFKK